MVRIYSAAPDQPLGFVSYPDYTDLRDGSRTLAGAVAQSQVLVAVGEPGGPVEVRLGLAVSANYFDLLGVPAALGRTFREGESREPVVVLAHRFWETHYGAVGQSIRIGGTPFLVIGVAAKDFGLDRFMHEDFYIPMEVYGTGLLPTVGHPLEDRSRRYLTVYGRRARGVGLPQAQAELNTIAGRLEAEHPETNRARRLAALTELASRMRAGPTLPALAALLIAMAALLLTIACANAAGMLLLRGEAKAHEIAIKLALGLSEARLLAQLLTESLLHAALGAAFGMPLAFEGTRMLAASLALPTDLPLAIAPRIDWRAAALAAGVTVLATVVCGVTPWIAARRTEAVTVLRTRGAGGSSSVSSGILRNALVAVEIGLAVALIATGGLLVRQFTAAGTMDLGYRLDHVLLTALDPGQTRYTEAQTRAFYRLLMEGAARLPGVRSVAMAQGVPLGFTGVQRQIQIEGQEHLSFWTNTVSSGYFELMHMRIVDGRSFDDRDTETSPPVVIVNEELARFWKRGEAVGRRIRMDGRILRVAGVVRTAKYFQLSEPPTPFFYLPYAQNYASRMVLHVETEGPPAASAPAVIGEVHGIDASQPVSEVRTLQDYFSQGGLIWIKVGLHVVGAVGLCGLLLGLTGLYSVVASAVARRRREIGIRVAVGASRCDVVALVLGHGAKLVALGIAGGLAMAMAISRLLGIGSGWPVLVLSAAGVATIAMAACLAPAWRATGIDPAIALREA